MNTTAASPRVRRPNVAKLWAIYKTSGKLRMSYTDSNSGLPTFIGPYIGTNKNTLTRWCLPGDTVQAVRIEREAERG